MVRTLDAVRRVLDHRPVVWFGIRGEDAASLLRIPEFHACYAITAPLHSATLRDDAVVTLETLSGRRVDLDRYDPDDDTSVEMRELRRRLLQEVSGRCVVMTYRPTAFISALAFAMSDTMTLAGLYKDRQAAFDNKPWVETSLERRGVRTLGWSYVHDEYRTRAARLLDEGPIVLRASRTSGGVGIARVDSPGEIDERWPADANEFVAVARYLEDVIPLNVSGCVFPDGTLRLHPPSVQLIGIESCTDRMFGYCGNDFGAVRAVDEEIIDDFEQMVREVGTWLHDERYVGVFGVDAIVHDGRVHFTEINPRFQGSSSLSAEIAAEMGVPDLFLDHLAANLGLAPVEEGLRLRDWARDQPTRAHVVVHNVSGGTVTRREDAPLPRLERGTRIAQMPEPRAAIDPGAVLGRIVVDESATETGFAIDEKSSLLVRQLLSKVAPAPTTTAAQGIDAQA